MYHAISVLSNGNVLVSGGHTSNSGDMYLNSTELYNSSTGIWTTASDMNFVRMMHAATVLVDGKVLVTGGYNTQDGYLNVSELYDPSI